MRRKGPLALLALALVALAAALGACGGDSGESGGGTAAAAKTYNQTDAAFAANMLPHHMSGVELGRMAVEKGVNPTIKRIGQDIVDAQTKEVDTLKGFLRTFGGEQPVMPKPIEERDKLDMDKLTKASGQEFDAMWLDVISGHHVAAIQMAQIENAAGKDPKAKDLSASIIQTQSRELEQFNELSGQMGG